MKKINWPNLIAEFLVVLLGILIAFQLNTCAVNKKQEQTVENHLTYLKKETTFNKSNIEKGIDFLKANLQKVDSLITLIQTNGDVTLMNTLSFDLLNYGSAYLQKNAYNSLITSGDIRFINNFNLKTKTINLYEFYTWVELDDKIGVDAYTKNYFPYVHNNFDLLTATPQSKDLYTTKEFKNILGTYRYSLKKRITKYEDCLTQINNYLQLLEN
jgi:hypothetical protein